MMPCVFCDIASKTIESHVVYEDALVVAFLDIDPIHKGHVLIVTKEHRFDLDDLSEDELFHVMKAAKIVLKALKETYPSDGYSMMQNGGIFNDMKHFHLHLFPRYKDDEFSWNFGEISEHALETVQEAIKEAIHKNID